MKIYLGVDPVDFRKGIDGFVKLCRFVLKEDPFGGSLFVFRNKRGSSIKILTYDGQGFWLFHKRLSKGKFNWWASFSENKKYPLDANELQQLLWNGDLDQYPKPQMWKKILKE